ncbi:MAG: UvrD-helicase domain-containing protein [Bacteroidales bacterium]|nr:UvrD-helicase domain-containing protein [Bacteroidales bacterium]
MLNIYKASAGSGKTYKLAGEFITEAFADTMAFSRILAVTFTNKAAGEMKERIIKELDNLSEGLPCGYFADIAKKYNLSEQALAKRAKNIRGAILHNYSDFNLKTIDSFVQRVLRSFCYDININSGFSTQTDEASVLSDLTDMLFKCADEDAYLKKQMLSMAEKNIKDGENWNFRAQVESIAKLIFTEKYKEFEAQQNQMKEKGMTENEKKSYFDISSELVNSVYDNYIETVREIAERAKKIIDSELGALPLSDLGANVKNCCNFLTNKLEEGVVSATAYKMQEKDDWLPAKAKKIQKEIIPGLQQRLQPVLNEAINFIENNATDFVTAKLIRKDFGAFVLIGEIAKLLPEYRKENRVIMISDASAFLDGIIAGNDAPFIYERTGNKFDHIFIDEFQDTSTFQWNNFRPLIENSIAYGFDNLIVGDVKQAIYRFRGGDWRLLNGKVQEQISEDNIKINSLDVNWRSRKNIVNFNNTIFQKSVETLINHGDADLPLDFEILTKIYSDSSQKLPEGKNRSGGKVEVIFFDKKEDEEEETENEEPEESFKEKALKKMADEIDTLIKSGVKAKKICVLVRKKDEAALAVKYLLQYQQQTSNAAVYDVVSSDSLYIANSLAVKVAVNAMKYLNNKEDNFAKAELMHSFCTLKQIEIDEDTVFSAVSDEETAKKFMPEGFENFNETYTDLPLYDLSEKIISLFGLESFEGDAEYLRTFQDCILNFTKQYSSDLNKFVSWWEQTGIKTSVQPSDNQNAVSVMTVHKSKGLDFSIQFIPFCNWKMEDVNNLNVNYIWVKAPENTTFSSLPSMPIRYSSEMLKSHFREFYVEEKRNLYVDSLNLLYVALTRAVDELHIYCPKPKESKKGENKISRVSDLLYYDIVEGEDSLSDYFDEETGIFLSDKNHVLEEGRKVNDRGKSFDLSVFKNSPWENKLAVTSHSSDFFIKNSTFLQERINYGLFMHDVMARIEFYEEYPEVLRQMTFQGRITENQAKDLSLKLNEVFSIEQVKHWFSKSWKEVLTEKALLTTEGDIKIPDRVLISDKETVVIDFKFGGEHEEYKAQISEYASLLKKMNYPNIKAYLFYVEDKKIEEIKLEK